MECWHCRRVAIGTCRFCGRAICENHIQTRPYILEVLDRTEPVRALVVEDALHCGAATPAPTPSSCPSSADLGRDDGPAPEGLDPAYERATTSGPGQERLARLRDGMSCTWKSVDVNSPSTSQRSSDTATPYFARIAQASASCGLALCDKRDRGDRGAEHRARLGRSDCVRLAHVCVYSRLLCSLVRVGDSVVGLRDRLPADLLAPEPARGREGERPVGTARERASTAVKKSHAPALFEVQSSRRR